MDWREEVSANENATDDDIPLDLSDPVWKEKQTTKKLKSP